ncbi:MAG: hypothetical protein J6R25_08875 [Bacteroidales bacterium]|nr:hypothetical protein [Bacteroidales bacterium]
MNLGSSEISIAALISRLWSKKIFIGKIVLCFSIIGLLVAITSPVEYTSSCSFIPQYSSSSQRSSASSLAALAGINLGGPEVQSLSPSLYPQLFDNVKFQKELIYSKVIFENIDEPITLLEYYSNPKYRKLSFFDFIKKYTIGLPGLIISKFSKPTSNESSDVIHITQDDDLYTYTRKEYNCINTLKSKIIISSDGGKGLVTITTKSGDAQSSAELCNIVFELLEKFVTEFKISKAYTQYEFIKRRYKETREDFEHKQKLLAEFQDANRVLSSAKAKIQLHKLTAEYDLANSINSEMARQLVQAELQVKQDAPIFTQLKPITVPLDRSKPYRLMIFILWLLMGFFISCSTVLFLDFLKFMGSPYPSKWDVEINFIREQANQ